MYLNPLAPNVDSGNNPRVILPGTPNFHKISYIQLVIPEGELSQGVPQFYKLELPADLSSGIFKSSFPHSRNENTEKSLEKSYHGL